MLSVQCIIIHLENSIVKENFRKVEKVEHGIFYMLHNSTVLRVL